MRSIVSTCTHRLAPVEYPIAVIFYFFQPRAALEADSTIAQSLSSPEHIVDRRLVGLPFVRFVSIPQQGIASQNTNLAVFNYIIWLNLL